MYFIMYSVFNQKCLVYFYRVNRYLSMISVLHKYIRGKNYLDRDRLLHEIGIKNSCLH